MKKTQIAALLALLAGCAAPPRPHELVEPTHPRTLVLAQDFQVPASGPDNPKAGPKDYYAALAGEYVAEFENDLMTYYRCRGACIVWWTDDAANLRAVQEGGIAVAKTGDGPRFLFYRFEDPAAERVEPMRAPPDGKVTIDEQTRAGALLRARGLDTSGYATDRTSAIKSAGPLGVINMGVVALLTMHTPTTKERMIVMSPPPADAVLDGHYTLR